MDGFAWQPGTLADLAGGDRTQNAEVIRRRLDGVDRGPKRDAVLLNSGAALMVAGRVKTVLEGCEFAGQLIDNGTAAAKLAQLQCAKG